MISAARFRTGLLAVALALEGCVGLGVDRIAIDRADYTERLRDSEKAELLSNIVALRFGDAPSFLSVSSVISQYTRETSGRIDLDISPPGNSSPGGVDGGVLFRETPTVTYSPMSGERFARNLLAPIPPASLLAMAEAGWATDDLFGIAVRSINGVRNGGRAPLFAGPGDPAFPLAVAALRRLQLSGALGLRLIETDGVYTAVARVRGDLTDQDRADMELLRQELGLATDGGELRIIFASDSAAPNELAITTRSMFGVLQEMSQGVDVAGQGAFDPNALVRIHSGSVAPRTAHVAVSHRGRWYWIEGDDDASKRVFLLAQVLMSLNDDSGAGHSPLVTIPAG